MTFAQSIVALFDKISILTVCLWATGVILFCVEFFQPMRGISYALGVMLISAAFVTCMIDGSAGEAFVYVLFTSLLLYIVHIVSLITQRRDWLRVSRMEKVGEKNRRLGRLMGQTGVANTPIDKIGNATVGGVTLVVYSEKPIAEGAQVRVCKVTADRITVEAADI